MKNKFIYFALITMFCGICYSQEPYPCEPVSDNIEAVQANVEPCAPVAQTVDPCAPVAEPIGPCEPACDGRKIVAIRKRPIRDAAFEMRQRVKQRLVNIRNRQVRQRLEIKVERRNVVNDFNCGCGCGCGGGC